MAAPSPFDKRTSCPADNRNFVRGARAGATTGMMPPRRGVCRLLQFLVAPAVASVAFCPSGRLAEKVEEGCRLLGWGWLRLWRGRFP